MSQFFYLQSQVVNSQDISLFSQPSISIANSQSFSITSSQHSISSTTSNRRLTDIKSVSSTQKCCFLCKNKDERKSIPKTALKQVWQEKNIFLPHHNRTCSSHLNNGKFTHEALALIVATKSGILMSDDEIAKWILELSSHSLPKYKKKVRFDFEDEAELSEDEYWTLTGMTKSQFAILSNYIKGDLHKYINMYVCMSKISLNNDT
jgi:hypothetical protein